MFKYKIFETKQYLNDLEKDFGGQHLKIKKKLKNYNPNTWRYRIGNYRLFYEIDEKEKLIIILTININNGI